MVKYGRTGKGTKAVGNAKPVVRSLWGNEGTVFYGLHHSPATVLECLAMLAERNSLAAIHRIKGLKEETAMGWLRNAANHVGEIEAMLLANYHLNRVQMDAMWTYVAIKGKKRTLRGAWPRQLLARHSGRYRHEAQGRRAIGNAATTSQLPST